MIKLKTSRLAEPERDVFDAVYSLIEQYPAFFSGFCPARRR